MANGLLCALGALAMGQVSRNGPVTGGGGPPLCDRSDQEQSFLKRCLARAAEFLDELPAGALHEDAALWRLLGLKVSPPPSMERRKGEARELRRGDVCPLEVDKVAMPSGDQEPRPLVVISPTAARHLSCVEALLRDPKEVKEEEAQPRHSDTALADNKVMLALAAKLWRSKMLRPIRTVKSYAGIFSVVKSVKPGGEIVQRLIFDMRRGNQFWKKPPWTALGGASAIAWSDFSACTGDLWIAAGDVPDYYHRLEVPEACSEYFALESIRASDLEKHLTSQGEKVELGDGWLGLRTVPMGWTWAVYLAQSCLSDLTVQGGELTSENALTEGAAIPRTDGLHPLVHSEYIDDFTVMGVVPPGEEKTVEEAYRRGTERIKAAGLEIHKETFARSAIVLGHQIGPGPRIRPPVEKAWRIVGATCSSCRW